MPAGSAAEELSDLAGGVFLLNGRHSNSGMNLPRRALAELAPGRPCFSRMIETGSQPGNLDRISRGEGDVTSADCVTYAFWQRHRPQAAEHVRVLAHSPPSPAIPFVTSVETPTAIAALLREALYRVARESHFARVRALLVTFAPEQQLAGMSAFDAAISAGRTRIRPVLMTAAAMIVGMIPMAIGGPGGEQNAALARAVGGLLFPGKVTRIADALNPATRTLMTEIDLPNPDGELSPGIYCRVELKIPRRTPSLIIPAGAIVFDRDGLHVLVVENGVVNSRKVTEIRDLGTEVEVSDGVKQGDQVVLSPPVDLEDSGKVRIRIADTAH